MPGYLDHTGRAEAWSGSVRVVPVAMRTWPRWRGDQEASMAGLAGFLHGLPD